MFTEATVYRQQASPNPESLVSETVTEIEKLKGALGTRARVLAHALASTYMYRRRGPIIVPKRQWWQDRDSRKVVRLSHFMSSGEFTKQREAVKDSLEGG